MRPIYLDHNATTPLLPEVVDGMLRIFVSTLETRRVVTSTVTGDAKR